MGVRPFLKIPRISSPKVHPYPNHIVPPHFLTQRTMGLHVRVYKLGVRFVLVDMVCKSCFGPSNPLSGGRR